MQFQPFQSAIDVDFWFKLSKKKVDEYKLDDSERPLQGDYDSKYFVLQESGTVSGTLYNFNTLEGFMGLNKKDYLTQKGLELWKEIKENNKILSFVVLTFADLKKYKYYYWVGFPTFAPSSPFTLISKEPGYSIQAPGKFFLVKGMQTAALDQFDDFWDDSCLLGFTDFGDDHPGWPLRNLLMWASFRLDTVKVLCLKKEPVILHVQLCKTQDPQVTGWEIGASGKYTARIMDLSPMMDPKQLADTSADLNLKLMKWRIVPELDLDTIKQVKCLLFGAGTLGCNISRLLLGWGVRHITFVDSGTVSYSNPVRQPLFTFQDCIDKKDKATAAADGLKSIFPNVTSVGINLTIPMTGHPVTDKTRGEIKKMEGLIKEHDIIFLLTDSRESRWLPTVLSRHYDKPVLTTALGFDTFVVMRHGMKGSDLGCYFCNDVVAPTDSLKNRTLDQQCTVSRPGVSTIASSMTVELMASCLSHPKGFRADPQEHSLLGQVPHQIRGFVSDFNQVIVTGRPFNHCVACSRPIHDALAAQGIDFLIRGLDSKVLEETAGLDELANTAKQVDVEWDDEEED